MSQLPLVTVVTPSFNQGHFIRATIESVLRQDYPHIEYIIMDGGSTDETAQIAGDYRGRLTFISEPDRGQTHAINKGFLLGRGSVLAWLNSDDVLLEGAVSKAVQALEESPEAAAVYGEGYLIDRAGDVTGRFPATQPFDLWRLMHVSDYILQQSTFMRRSALEAIGYLDETLHYTMDWDLWIRLGFLHPLRYLPEYLGCLREYPEAKSFAGGKRRIREIGQLLRKHTGLRWPPGLLSYGWETYQDLYFVQTAGRLPRWLRPALLPLRYAATLLVGYLLVRAVRDAQGLYADGWASRRLHYWLPPGEGEVVIRGEVPADQPALSGQTLVVLCNGQQAGRFEVGSGDFNLQFTPPPGRNGPLRLEILASKHFKRRFSDEPFPRRRLSYRLRSIAWKNA